MKNFIAVTTNTDTVTHSITKEDLIFWGPIIFTIVGIVAVWTSTQIRLTVLEKETKEMAAEVERKRLEERETLKVWIHQENKILLTGINNQFVLQNEQLKRLEEKLSSNKETMEYFRQDIEKIKKHLNL